jgi:drug/metabolite transporter (DMT)-like permease
MVYLLGLLSALTFALGLALQQRGTLQTAAPEGDSRFLRQILRKPVWLLGCLMLFAGWLLQAAALNRGSLALVQSLQALSLVFALPLGMWLTNQRVGLRSVAGACTTLVGIIVLVTVGRPQGGIPAPAALAWWVAGAVIVFLVVALALVARLRRGPVSATLFGTAAGLAFAFQAASTKMLVIQFHHGWATIFSNWPLYVFIVAELLGFTLQQAALKCGCLAAATAALNAATLAASVLLGVTVFQESFGGGSGRLVAAIAGLLIAVAGVVALASSGFREPRAAAG